MERILSKDLFKALFRLTLINPREAGRRIVALSLPPQGLWMALALMSILLSLTVAGLLQLVPLPDGPQGEALRLSPAYHSPLIFALFQWGQSVITVFVLYWVGQAFGGRGRMADMLAVMIWLQVVSLVLACGLFVIELILPALGGMLMLLTVFWGLWATVGLVDAAHDFDNMFKSFLVFVAAVAATAVGLTVILGLVGLMASGSV